jgi:histidinol-phosphate aminotransferase
MVWLCHPNNPTGEPFPIEQLPAACESSPDTLFVVDEAYLALAEDLPSAAGFIDSGQVVVLRSLTKDAGLAGLRIGYALAAPAVADAVGRMIPPWNVNAFAQAAGLAALADVEHATKVRAAVAASREHLRAGLLKLGLALEPSVTNFVLVQVGDGADVAAQLLAEGIAVRDCASFGLPAYIRIGVRSIADQDRLLAALAGVLASSS